MQQKKREKLKKKEKKKGKAEKKWKNVKKKKEESIVDYCCNPQWFWVWGNSDSPTPFRCMYNFKGIKLQSEIFNQLNI